MAYCYRWKQCLIIIIQRIIIIKPEQNTKRIIRTKQNTKRVIKTKQNTKRVVRTKQNTKKLLDRAETWFKQTISNADRLAIDRYSNNIMHQDIEQLFFLTPYKIRDWKMFRYSSEASINSFALQTTD